MILGCYAKSPKLGRITLIRNHLLMCNTGFLHSQPTPSVFLVPPAFGAFRLLVGTSETLTKPILTRFWGWFHLSPTSQSSRTND